MDGHAVLDGFLDEHKKLRQRLDEWRMVLTHTCDSSYEECQRSVSTLRGVCRFLEHELTHHLQEEEAVLYPTVKRKLPQLRRLVTELEQEHEVIRQVFLEFRRDLTRFNRTGELGQLPRLGQELIAYLHYHVDREDRALNPIVLKEFKETDWSELNRLHSEPRVA